MQPTPRHRYQILLNRQSLMPEHQSNQYVQWCLQNKLPTTQKPVHCMKSEISFVALAPRTSSQQTNLLYIYCQYRFRCGPCLEQHQSSS